jgi:hypothetical protein
VVKSGAPGALVGSNALARLLRRGRNVLRECCGKPKAQLEILRRWDSEIVAELKP